VVRPDLQVAHTDLRVVAQDLQVARTDHLEAVQDLQVVQDHPEVLQEAVEEDNRIYSRRSIPPALLEYNQTIII